MRKSCAVIACAILGVGLPSATAVAMDEDESTNGEGGAGCDEDPTKCSLPDPEQDPPSGDDPRCGVCDTWEATCDTSMWSVCYGSDQSLDLPPPGWYPDSAFCLLRCGMVTSNCEVWEGGLVACHGWGAAVYDASGHRCEQWNIVDEQCQDLRWPIPCRRDPCGNTWPDYP